jgi:hypothetical protein
MDSTLLTIKKLVACYNAKNAESILQSIDNILQEHELALDKEATERMEKERGISL